MLRALRESHGGAIAVSDSALCDAQERLARNEGIDACPEGGATAVAAAQLVERGAIRSGSSVVLFNTGAGWLYR